MQTIFLHNSEERKPKPAAYVHNRGAASADEGVDDEVLIRSFGAVFSSERSVQDILKMMVVTPSEANTVHKVMAFLTPIVSYAQAVGRHVSGSGSGSSSASTVIPSGAKKKKRGNSSERGAKAVAAAESSDNSGGNSGGGSGDLVNRDFTRCVRLFMDVIELLVKGDGFGFDSSIDWVKVANDTLPAGFSKKFEGEPDGPIQDLCRDLKLMDAVFAVAAVPYARASDLAAAAAAARKSGKATTSTSSAAEEQEEAARLAASMPFVAGDPIMFGGARAIQKFAHVALQTLVAENSSSQAYFGKRNLLVTTATKKVGEAPPFWMDNLLFTLDDPLGSAVTLAKLLSSSPDLMARYATPELVERFADMVRRLGPQPRLLNFFSAISAVGGRPVKANQEMILRLVWMKEETRRMVMLQIVSFPGGGGPEGLATLPKLQDANGKDIDGQYTAAETKTFPKAFIGKPLVDSGEGFPPVFVTWQCGDDWAGNAPLFFGPEKMANSGGGGDGGSTGDGDALNRGLRWFRHPDAAAAEEKGQSVLVRIEDFCWVLDPARLCEVVTGRPWKAVKAEKEADTEAGKDAAARFKKQSQLASFFVMQLDVMGKMCFGNSDNCQDWLQKDFSYELLVSLINNPYLPAVVRSGFVSFVRMLYVDRYPQVENMGRPCLPEQLWIYEIRRADYDRSGLPLIRGAGEALKLNEEGALPAFGIPPSHRLANSPDEKLSFPGHTKFFMLRHFCNSYLAVVGKGGALVHADKTGNELTIKVIEIIMALLSYGFQSTIQKIEPLLEVLVPMLDGRADCLQIDGKGALVAFEPLESRYRMSTDSPNVTKAKVKAIEVLTSVANLRANFRLAKILETFKRYREDARGMGRELRRHGCFVRENRVAEYRGPLTGKLFDEFEALFEKGDGARMDFDALSKQPVDTILLDCLMYEDDEVSDYSLLAHSCNASKSARARPPPPACILIFRSQHNYVSNKNHSSSRAPWSSSSASSASGGA